ncbi:MAG: patatin-like phospholipase family protein [Gammaproteobacteria bacterium]
MRIRKKRINLALQGGGSHGAFTWGVLDRLLEEADVVIEGISGTSAGAMNAIALAQGFCNGGRESARESLDRFWNAVAQHSPYPLQPNDSDNDSAMTGNDVSPLIKTYMNLSHFLSPLQINPLDINPLRDILDEQIDFERIRRESNLKLFVIATNVRSGQMRVFKNEELSVDALLASSCLPSIHRPIEIDNEIYWDGAFSGNPAIYPLVYDTECNDMVIVLLQPMSRPDTPQTAEAIHNRISELSLISPFLREMRALARVRLEVEKGVIPATGIEKRIARLRFYLIQDEALMNQLAHGSQFNTHKAFLNYLKEAGRRRGEEWLGNFDKDPKTAQIDIQALFAV